MLFSGNPANINQDARITRELSVIKEEIKQINNKLKSVDDEAEKERLISEGVEGTATATRHNLT